MSNPILVLIALSSLALISCDKRDGAVNLPGNESGNGSIDAPSIPLAAIPDFSLDDACEPVGNGVAYEVGPGKNYENIIDVPYESLKPGDVVKIHARPEPYFERILITTAKGTIDAPISICGVPDVDGRLPILDGTRARVRETYVSNYFNENTAYAGVIVISNRHGDHPEHIKIKNLQLQGAHQFLEDGNQQYYVMGTDELGSYSRAASGITMRGSFIEVSNCIIQENGNGIFGAHNGLNEELTDVKLQNNIIRHNGTNNVDRQHNIYIESDGLLAVGNQIGPIREGSSGANYKSRSAGDVIMYNKLLGPASRHFDLVDSQNGYPILAEKDSFRHTFVVGNIVVGIEGGAGNILHYGGDGDASVATDKFRQGTVYTYNNTFVLKGYFLGGDELSQYRRSFMDLNTCNETLYAFNNIFAYENTGPANASDSEISAFRNRGVISTFSNNLMANETKRWYVDRNGEDPCSVGIQYSLIEESKTDNAEIKFVDLTNNDFRLSSGSVAIDAGMPIPTELLPVESQFKAPNSIEARPTNGAIDIGAYEF